MLTFGTYRKTPQEAYQEVSAAIHLGVRRFDTAAFYKNEAAVQQAIDDSKLPREQFTITTKIFRRDFLADKLGPAIDRALTIFRGQIDVLLLHSYAGVECYRQFTQLVQARPGTRSSDRASTLSSDRASIRQFGVSNYSIAQLTELVEAGGPLPYCNQIEFSPLHPQVELVEFCQRHGIRVEAHSIFGQGRWPTMPRIIEQIAQDHNVSRYCIIANWVRSWDVMPVVNTSTVPHLQELLTIVNLSPGELDQISQITDRFIVFRQFTDRARPHKPHSPQNTN